MQPLVSTRISLAWPPAAPFEETDTLVIQGRTGFFLDLRIFNNGPRLGEIDWASAGVKRFLPDSTPDNPKAVFEAIIDSRRPPPSPSSPSPTEPPPPDEGSFTSLPNSDVLETGSMSNPDAGGAIQPYEEVWRRFAVEEDVRVLILASEGGDRFLGRVGRWEVGLGDWRTSTPFLARRRDQRVDTSWTETYCVGGAEAEEQLPRLPDAVKGSIGDTVELGGRRWVIKENS